MTKRRELEAALVKAEAALANAVINTAAVDEDRTEADANTEKLRAHCRRVQAALVKAKRREPVGGSGEALDIHIRQLREASKRMPYAIPPSRRLVKHPVRAKNNRSHNESGRREHVRRFNTGFLALRPAPQGALAWYLLKRQATGFLILILAYLEYFYIDVQLQIASLRSIFG